MYVHGSLLLVMLVFWNTNVNVVKSTHLDFNIMRMDRIGVCVILKTDRLGYGIKSSDVLKKTLYQHS